jgi:diguanylate cyclase (GGDEF)-like protein
MGDFALVDLIESWLQGPARHLGLRFPGPLEARFESDTRVERSRSLMMSSIVGLLMALALYPILLTALPARDAELQLLYVATLPLGAAVIALMWFDPPPVLREASMLAITSFCICIMLALLTDSPVLGAPLFVGVATVLMAYCTIGIQLRFPYAVAAIVLILLTYCVATDLRPSLGDIAREHLKLLAACTAAYLLLANWRLELEQRRGYLMTLREKLKRYDLTLRNLELDELTRRDPLTGLCNRRAYDGWLASAWAQEGARQGRLGLIVIDVDKFKEYNDFCGHDAGDSCLKTIAVCLRDQLRGTSDRVARLGGEEFAIILPGLSEETCADIAERVRLAVQRLDLPHLALGLNGLVTISCGVASHAVLPGGDPASLFQAADAALYQAKVFGRNRVCIATLASGTVAPATVTG